MLCKLTYAMSEKGEVVHISETERGLACKCVCPACGDTLIARKGDEVEHHFAHASGTDCQYGFASSLYCAFYREIKQLGYLVLPPYIKNRSVVEGSSGIHKIMPRAKVRVDSVELTKKANGAVTAIAAYCSGKPLLIKLLTAYTTGKKNMSQITALGLPMLEIDLSREDTVDDTSVNRLLTTAPPQIYWLYNQRAEKLWEQLSGKCERLSVFGSDNAIYTNGCTASSKRDDSFRCFIKTGCSSCDYFFGLYGFDEERYILCGRRSAIKETADLELSLAERKKKYRIL